MTVDVDNPRRLEFVGNGSDVNYPYDFLIFQDTDLNVFIDGNLQVVNADYTVTGINQQGGGNVVFTVAPLDQSGIIIDSNVPATQTVDFEVGGKFKPDTVNFVNDKLTVIDQQIKTLLKQRGLLYPETSFLDSGGKDNVLPPLGAQLDKEIPIWSKNKDNTIIATFLEEAGDLSNLRAELEDESESSPGTGLIGYYDEFDCTAPVGKTLDVLLKQIAPLIDCRIAAVNEADPTKRVRFDLSELPTNTTTVFKFHNNPAGSIPTGAIIDWPTETAPDGYLECNGQDVDYQTDTAPTYASDLFAVIGTKYGVGSQVYEPDRLTVFPPNEQGFFSAVVGAPVTGPSPGSTGFTINVFQPGNNSNRETVKITFLAGNAIPPGSFFTLHSPKGDRKNIVWYSVDGSGTAPVDPGAFISEVQILSTDTAEQVRDKTKFAFNFAQFKVPDTRGLFVRGYSSDTPENPLPTEIDGIASITNPGTGYAVNDIVLTSDPTTLFPGEAKVLTIGGSGEVQTLELTNRGRFAGIPAASQNMFGGSGAGLIISIGSEFIDPDKNARLSFPYSPSDEAQDPNIVIGSKIGSWQRDEVMLHIHTIPGSAVTNPSYGPGAYSTGSGNPEPITSNDSAPATLDSGGKESRGRNISFMQIIKT